MLHIAPHIHAPIFIQALQFSHHSPRVRLDLTRKPALDIERALERSDHRAVRGSGTRGAPRRVVRPEVRHRANLHRKVPSRPPPHGVRMDTETTEVNGSSGKSQPVLEWRLLKSQVRSRHGAMAPWRGRSCPEVSRFLPFLTSGPGHYLKRRPSNSLGEAWRVDGTF